LHQLFSSPKPLQTCSYMLMKLIIIWKLLLICIQYDFSLHTISICL
jgi:hypothetical protein